MLSNLNLTAAFFAATISASNILSGSVVLRADDVLSRPYAAIRDISAMPGMGLGRREDQKDVNATVGDVQLNPDGTLNVTAWNAATDAACKEHLGIVMRSTNPSGNCICYNLPSLDVKTGVFEADLRLYRVSQPRESFVGVAPGDVQVGVAYSGASVSRLKPESMSGMGMVGDVSRVTKRVDEVADVAGGPTLVQAYMLVGQIDKAKMQDDMSMSALEALLIPTLTLTAKTTTGVRVSTNVSLNEASFLTGVFSSQIIMSDFAAAQAAVDDQVAALRNGTIAFVLPGVQLMVFPIGLVITSVWFALGIAAYGYGTFERIQYAEAYRERKSRQGS